MNDRVESDLFRLLPRFSGLKRDVFMARFLDEVGDLADEVVTGSYSTRSPKREITVYAGGLVLVVGAHDKLSLYETQTRVEEREHIAAWAEFARGHWSAVVPSEPGVYPTRDAERRRGDDHMLILHGGQLRDLNSGYLVGETVTNWRGEFWSVCYPRLPESL